MSKRKELRDLKYAYIKNSYGDTKMARQARDWGWERIYKELALKKPRQDKIDLKTHSESTIRTKNLELRKIKSLYDMGFTPEQMFKKKKRTLKYIDRSTRTLNIDGNELKIAYSNDRDERFEIWRYWSDKKSHNMPERVKNVAQKINRSYKTNSVVNPKLDDNDHYGFAFIYFMFIDNKNASTVEKEINPDLSGTYKVEYLEIRRVGR